jgi:hypothetical protein
MQKLFDILGSPRFWATLIALAFIITKALVPTIPLDEGQITAAVVALVAFIVSVSVQGSPTVWLDLLKSGKFWALLASLTFIFIRAFAPAFPLTEEQVLAVILALSGVSVGTSYRPINTGNL